MAVALAAFPAVRSFADSLTVDATEPTGSSIIAFNPHSTHTGGGSPADLGSLGERDTFTTIFPAAASAPGDRGQTFTVPSNPYADTWDLNAITLRADVGTTTQTGVPQDFSSGTNSMKLWVVEWNPNTDANSGTNWTAGDGIGSDGDPFDGTGISNILVNAESFDVSRSFSGDFMHFNLGASNAKLKNNIAYAFIVAFEADTAGFKLDSVRDNVSPNGQSYAFGAILRADNTSQTINSGSGDDLVFYVDATPSPEPATAAFLGVGSIMMLSKRTRRRV
jgi:hypothetical protein